MVNDLNEAIINRETERQRIHAENRTARIQAVCIAAVIIALIAGVVIPILYSIDTPDPKVIASGTEIDCVVVAEGE